MGFLTKYFTLILLLFIAQYDSSNSVTANFVQETDALLALKAIFNDPFLNKNWTGSLHCYADYPSQWYGIQCSHDDRVTGISLQSMGLTGKVSADAFAYFPELTLISLNNNSISGNVVNLSSNRKMKHIDLSGNRLYGQISPSLLSLDLLESLQLQDNSLTGPIPEFNQSSLKVFNVSNNNLKGKIPTTPVLQSFSSASYYNNQGLCGPPAENPCNSSAFSEKYTSNSDNKDSSKRTYKFATVFLIFDVIGLVAVMLLFILYYKRAKKLKKMIKNMQKDLKEAEAEVEVEAEAEVEVEAEAEAEERVVAVEEKREENNNKKKLIFMEGVEAEFELNDLFKAPAEGLGKGIFGNTYKAKLEGYMGIKSVVVKRLRDLKPLSNEEFTKQVNMIHAHHNHPNLLPLLAYYYSKDEKLLVYKYAENGNLFNRIHGEKSSKDRIAFTWSSRLSVARGVARALEYLHINISGMIPHGNLKSTNILLDEHETVVVSDYGLSSLVALPIASQRMVSYKSPEYQSNKRVSRKSDVWSYGCLLLELLTSRVSVHSAPPGINGVDLSTWVHRAVREEWTAEIFDPEISKHRRACHGMLKLLQIALRCCDKSPEKRPEMTEVVRVVENIKVVEESEDEEDLSGDPSLTDDSLSITAPAMVAGDQRL
ncbi:hypothetical protein Ddye_002021 [Dipteronia dyeriana]|uniref:Protein kinase domain-containing protein n=1 Tax=Dipteronia dyeriana TaxID=168575 RepID=A0AAE0CU19_9ROSI|nr:hypothetical protein Ddye_002021 [Dipteronia dyeriana]